MADVNARNKTTLKKFAIVTAVMFAFGYALVPFYKKICEATGVAQSRVISNTQLDPSRWVTVEFDSNLSKELPWKFEPVTANVKLHPGEVKQVMYRVKNLTDRTMVGQAIPAYAPLRAASYFQKIECFCFTQQTLKAGEERLMPVQFVVRNDLPKDVNTIVLSYTFYEQQPKAAEVKPLPVGVPKG